MKFAFNPFTGKLDLVQDVSGFVPYVGATADVNLGAHTIVAANLSGTNTGDQTLPTPGGIDTNFQFNDGGSFGGASFATWNKAIGQMKVGDFTNAITPDNGTPFCVSNQTPYSTLNTTQIVPSNYNFNGNASGWTLGAGWVYQASPRGVKHTGTDLTTVSRADVVVSSAILYKIIVVFATGSAGTGKIHFSGQQIYSGSVGGTKTLYAFGTADTTIDITPSTTTSRIILASYSVQAFVPAIPPVSIGANNAEPMQIYAVGGTNVLLGYGISPFMTGPNNTSMGYGNLGQMGSGYQNTGIGTRNIRYGISCYGNVGIGYNNLAAIDTTSSFYNIGIGVNNFSNMTVGNNNIAFGTQIATNLTSGDNNVGIGYNALASASACSQNLAFGNSSLYSNTIGNNNLAFGYQSLYTNSSGSLNLAVGQQALYSNSTGSNNVAIGIGAGNGCLGSSNIFIGYTAGFVETGSNRLYIDVTGTNTPLIYGEFDNQKLKTSGRFYPAQATTAGAPAYELGAMYFDTTLNKLRIGGATTWETVTSL